MEGILIRAWDFILPVYGATSTLAQGATLAARWLHEPLPISNQPVGSVAARWLHEPQPVSNQLVGLGFPHRAQRYRSGGSAFSSPDCWSCKVLEIF